MIRLDLARELQRAGVPWEPAAGDRFVVPDKDMDDEVFWISDMTIEVHERPSGRVLGFNGTTEWALDSLRVSSVLWLPREDQLRDLLAGDFRALRRDAAGWTVEVAVDGDVLGFTDADVESAYARAVLATRH
ncbi:pilus assembly protein CpaE [Thalassiella azotivora]